MSGAASRTASRAPTRPRVYQLCTVARIVAGGRPRGSRSRDASSASRKPGTPRATKAVRQPYRSASTRRARSEHAAEGHADRVDPQREGAALAAKELRQQRLGRRPVAGLAHPHQGAAHESCQKRLTVAPSAVKALHNPTPTAITARRDFRSPSTPSGSAASERTIT